MRRFLIILVACVLVKVPGTGDCAAERRIALVIGNSAYRNSPLRNPVNDATDMASVLESLGFTVSLKTDANLRTMKESVRAFGRQLNKGGVGLFYYAGHGIQYRGRNYLIPVHSEVESAADVEYEAVAAGRVLAQMENAGNSLNIIILGRRKADGNYTGPKGQNIYTNKQGVTRYSPIVDWSHEEVLAVCHYFSGALPPTYHWPNGFVVGTGAWPARQWTGSIANGWQEVYTIDTSIVIKAAKYIPSALEFLRRVG